MKLPIGCDDFERIREEENYYVDKTYFIKELLEEDGNVFLFTRPRRFGKTLMLSMLKSFFSIHSNPSFFDGLAISREKDICRKYQGNYPVIFLSLKGVDGLTFEKALNRLSTFISRLFQEFIYLLDDETLSYTDRTFMRVLIERKGKEEDLISSLNLLLSMLYRHYGQNVILLIDEYDVPLDKAYYHGYYEEMVSFIRGFLGDVLKTNPYLKLAVLTGCLRISKESIFTGLNNFRIDTVSNQKFARYFGFLDSEVMQMLADYHLSGAYGKIKEWYDGYRFGNEEIYCPWDVLNYVSELKSDPEACPRAFWKNTSSNSIIRDLLKIADKSVKDKIEVLSQGGSVTVHITEDLTYSELRKKPENLWSMLYLTGYLTLAGSYHGNPLIELRIPNKEIHSLFEDQIKEWMEESIYPSCHANILKCLFDKKPEQLQTELNKILIRTISFYDYGENFYHALLIGLLLGEEQYDVQSNKENGLGRSDITVKDLLGNDVIIIEVKHSQSRRSMAEDCDIALKQIEKERYADPFLEDGYDVWKYGISFYKKECCVKFLGES